MASEPETEEQQQARYDRQFAEFFQQQQPLQEQPQEQAQQQPRPSVGEEMGSAFW